MFAIRTFIFIAIVIVPSWTHIPYDEVPINIFDSKQTQFELRVSESIERLKGFFNRDDVSLGIGIAHTALKFVPYIGEFVKLIPLLQNNLEGRSEWRTAFTKAVKDEINYSITESEIRWMKTTMKTIRDKIKLLNESNPDIENRKTIASIIHTDFDKMINFFDLKSSLFRRYPLLGAPPLIQLASLVAIFSPLAKELIPIEAMNSQISCKMYHVLLDYRPLTVVARLRKLYTHVSAQETTMHEAMRNESSFITIMSLPYNELGYNSTNPPAIDCQPDCVRSRLFLGDVCLIDTFTERSYYSNDIGSLTCIIEYGALIRHRIERLFPVELLNSLCVDRKSRVPTGYGWFTFNLLGRFIFTSIIHIPIQWNPYLKLFVNGEQVLESKTKTDKLHDDIIYQSGKIRKNSVIKLEIWLNDNLFWTKDEMIFQSEGDVESFLTQPTRRNNQNSTDFNTIQTISFWRDEYE